MKKYVGKTVLRGDRGYGKVFSLKDSAEWVMVPSYDVLGTIYLGLKYGHFQETGFKEADLKEILDISQKYQTVKINDKFGGSMDAAPGFLMRKSDLQKYGNFNKDITAYNDFYQKYYYKDIKRYAKMYKKLLDNNYEVQKKHLPKVSGNEVAKYKRDLNKVFSDKPLNESFSRGSLYRKRYFGRY